MKMFIKSVFVPDQAKALKFYTNVLGFEVKQDIPLGEYRWLTVVSPEEPDGVQLLLEPNQHQAAKAYQEALFADGIPCTSFSVEDVDAEYERLVKAGVGFTVAPMVAGNAKMAVFDDTCGNLIQIVELL
ncbi:VOC family protein [Kordiimonas lacus]|uniref:VOC domain-containing protein n=1 Tax=Kordiimonas lacus TaxID=637679 RepID=A0A1G7B992_9PROT|nr:VOC family protein [Kordiimonas lacus]SDE22886.1 hypothetical protein SAMN04488071_2394 [Kordiimonas lacus]